MINLIVCFYLEGQERPIHSTIGNPGLQVPRVGDFVVLPLPGDDEKRWQVKQAIWDFVTLDRRQWVNLIVVPA